ncbi:MAG: hypothetical protein P1V51_03415 [Deltaproteobacteria bacterium]|nr:hypothetical protein [Deltaproteobacteria bacterium]
MNLRHHTPGFVPLLLTLLLTACPAAQPKDEAPVAAVDPLRTAEMIQLRDQMEVARLRTRIAQLQAELEGQAGGGEAWAVISVSLLQLRSDADAAWNRMKEVVSVLGNTGGASYWAHLGMAEVYLIWELPDQARGEVEAALALYPATAPALERQGRIALARKKDEEARAAFTAAWSAGGAKGAPFAGLELARLEREADGPAALARVQEVLAAHPELIEVLVLAAELSEDGPEKTALLQRAVERAPESGELAGALAGALEGEGKDTEALAAWHASAKTHPADLEAWRAVARLARQAEDEAIERESLEKIAELDPNETAALVRLAELKGAIGDLEGAEAAWTEILTRKADDGGGHLARGKVREAREDYRTAMADYREARTLGHAEAEASVQSLAGRIGLPAKALQGKSPDQVYGRVARVLGKAYGARLKETPELGGTLSIQVWVEKGAVAEANVVENSLHDPLMEALAYWLVFDAAFPTEKGRKEYTLPFTFDPADYKP